MNSIIHEIKIYFFLKLEEIYYFYLYFERPTIWKYGRRLLVAFVGFKKKKKLHLCIEKNGKQEDRLERIT